MSSKILVIIALLVAFCLGSASGYFVRTATASSEQTQAAVCPVGTHPEVWYSAGAWACVADQ
ncbi:MAG TPA: hypothetical protein VGE99_06740 [Candidatus Dormibacteraeota bacterium]